ncbi:MAG: LPS export ABC transporter permease LptG [Gammaproteobacteria bacterium]|nr:LPS export ABC transporter permease LptG [Gammaproteobacteria bacterium]
MKILDIYLARSVLIGIVIALLIICAIDWLGDLFYQVGRMSAGDKFSDVLILTLLDVPHKLFEFLPSSMLIGALFSLGQFAASSELVAVGAGGYSRFRVGMISCIAGLLVTVVLTVVVEIYVPFSDKISLAMLQDDEENILLASDESYWVRDQDRFIRVGRAVSQDLLSDVAIYGFNKSGYIDSISEAKSAIRMQDLWHLKGYRSSLFSGENNVVIAKNSDIHPMPDLFLSSFLQSVTSDPFKMSVQRLYEYISYLEQNHLDAREYQVAFFKRMAVPFVGLAMLLLALPLVFRPRQLGGAGQRLLIGMVIALLVYIVVEAITNGAVVYKFSPILVAFLPVILILACSMFAFKFTR